MDPLTIAAAGGMRSRMETLSLLANNLANAATSGYKTDRESYGLYISAAADAAGDPPATLPMVQRQWTDFSQGTLEATGNPLDVAISGKGFLAVNGPSGPLYTRNGNLRINSAGELATGEGLPVRSTEGTTIKVASAEPLEITTEGTVRQNGRALGRIAVVNFKSTSSLEKTSGTCFQNTDAQNSPAPAEGVQLLQGKVEASNVAVPEAAMRLVGVMRQFEMLQKAVSMGVEMNAKAIQEVARVGS